MMPIRAQRPNTLTGRPRRAGGQAVRARHPERKAIMQGTLPAAGTRRLPPHAAPVRSAAPAAR